MKLGIRAGLALAFLVLLCACGPRADSEQITLEFWTIALKPKFVPYFTRVLGDFENRHPGVKVQWLDLPQASIMPKLMASIAGGMAPDVVNMTTGTALTLARQGALWDVSSGVSPEQQNLYWPNLWRAASYEGGVYAIPWYVSTRVLIYNQGLLRAAGWPADEAPRTWEDVATIAGLVRQHTSAYGYEPVIRLIDDWRMAGIGIYDPLSGRATFNTGAGQERLRWYADLRRRGLIPEETLIEGYKGAVDRFKQGNLALLEGGPQLLLSIEADAPQVYSVTDIGYLPVGKSGEIPAALMDLVIPRSSRHRELALELALEVTNKANQLELVREVPLLPSTVVREDELFPDGNARENLRDKALRCSFAQLQWAQDFSLGLPRANELEKSLKEAVEAVFYGQAEPAEALQSAEKNWNDIIQCQ